MAGIMRYYMSSSRKPEHKLVRRDYLGSQDKEYVFAKTRCKGWIAYIHWIAGVHQAQYDHLTYASASGGKRGRVGICVEIMQVRLLLYLSCVCVCV